MSATALILAAGEGTRMKSSLPKVAHRILGVPMVNYVIDAARQAGVEHVVVVTGHRAEVVESLLAGSGVSFARQDEQLGTGHAVMCGLAAMGELAGPVVVLAGDVPLVGPDTIARLIGAQEEHGAAGVLLTAFVPDPTGYGRIIRGDGGSVNAIIEHKDLPPELVGVNEINAGMYCFDGRILSKYLERLDASNAQGEYYLTDLVALFVGDGLAVEAVITDDATESYGVNSRVQLAEASKVMQQRINERLMLEGVTITDPGLAWIGPHVTVGRDTVVEPMCFLAGQTTIGEGCTIGPNSRITDSVVGDGCCVDSSIVTTSRLASGLTVGPWAQLTSETRGEH